MPPQWKYKKDPFTGRKKKMSPKLTEDSYGSIKGELGRMVGEWRTLRSRKSTLVGLINLQREDGRVAMDTFTIGTNTFRCRHRGIVNIPGARALIGSKVRQCFIAEVGRVLVSADSDSNQLRGFAHYLNNSEVSAAIATGTQEEGTDVHTRTANLLGIERPRAKDTTYALLFGSGDATLAESAGRRGEGVQVRKELDDAFPGFKELSESVEEEWDTNADKYGRGFVTGLDGRRVYCERRKAFNALLQCFEAVTCKEACVKAESMLREEGIPAKLVAHIHDEFTYEVFAEDSERVSEIMEYCFGEHITNHYNLNCPMGGSAAVGPTWAEVH